MEKWKSASKSQRSKAPTARIEEPVALRQVTLTEDEADLIIALRRKDEPGIPLEEVLAEHGYTLDD